MSHTTDTSLDDADFPALVAEMVAQQAPRVFAVVLEYGEQVGAEIDGWGMALDEGAYVTTDDGRTQYVLAEPENILKYFPSSADTTAYLVWPTASADARSCG